MNPQSDVPYFPPEIISRMSSHTVIMFNHLRTDAILKIIKTNLEKQIQLLKKNTDMISKTAMISLRLPRCTLWEAVWMPETQPCLREKF